jgi:hypothetical protein
MSDEKKSDFVAAPQNPPTQSTALPTTDDPSVPKTKRAEKAARKRAQRKGLGDALEKTMHLEAQISAKDEARKRREMKVQEKLDRETHAARQTKLWAEIYRQQQANRTAQLALAAGAEHRSKEGDVQRGTPRSH